MNATAILIPVPEYIRHRRVRERRALVSMERALLEDSPEDLPAVMGEIEDLGL